jgi:hypothetical protein
MYRVLTTEGDEEMIMFYEVVRIKEEAVLQVAIFPFSLWWENAQLLRDRATTSAQESTCAMHATHSRTSSDSCHYS